MNDINFSKINSKNIKFLKDSYIDDYLNIKYPGIDMSRSNSKVQKDLETLVLEKNHVIYIAKNNTNAVCFVIGKVSSNKFFKKEVVISNFYRKKGLLRLIFKKINLDYNVHRDFKKLKPFKHKQKGIAKNEQKA